MMNGNGEQDEIRQLARRIAERIRGETFARSKTNADTNEVASLRTSLAELNNRLAQLEAQSGDEDNKRQDEKAYARSTHTASMQDSGRHEPTTDSGIDRTLARAPWLLGGGGTYFSAVHPSEQRFGIGEAVTELVDYFEGSKTCDIEPGSKPCDHCGVCSARGF